MKNLEQLVEIARAKHEKIICVEKVKDPTAYCYGIHTPGHVGFPCYLLEKFPPKPFSINGNTFNIYVSHYRTDNCPMNDIISHVHLDCWRNLNGRKISCPDDAGCIVKGMFGAKHRRYAGTMNDSGKLVLVPEDVRFDLNDWFHQIENAWKQMKEEWKNEIKTFNESFSIRPQSIAFGTSHWVNYDDWKNGEHLDPHWSNGLNLDPKMRS